MIPSVVFPYTGTEINETIVKFLAALQTVTYLQKSSTYHTGLSETYGSRFLQAEAYKLHEEKKI